MNTETASADISFDEVASAASSLQNEGKPVTLEAIREALGGPSLNVVHKHLAAWRASNATPPEPPRAELPAPLLTALTEWARQFAEDSGAGVREALAQSESELAALASAGEQLEAERDGLLEEVTGVTAAREAAQTMADERAEEIERLTAELRNAREVAMEALVGKAKDQLAIEGKDNQLAELRKQIERNVAESAAQSDARLAAEMELVGAVTARDSLTVELKDLRAQLDACIAERTSLRAELEALRKKK